MESNGRTSARPHDLGSALSLSPIADLFPEPITVHRSSLANVTAGSSNSAK
jgi:hypothetical protein